MSSAIETLETNLQKNLSEANAAASEPQAAISMVLITTIIQAVLSALTACKGTTASGIQEMKSGSPRVRRLVRARLVNEEYGRLKDYREKGGERVTDATLKTVADAPDELLTQAVAEYRDDQVASGVNYGF